MRGPTSWRLYLFTFFLLLVSCGIRSGVFVDTTFLPRVLLLTLLLLITWLLTFRKPMPSLQPVFTGSLLLLYLWSLASAAWAIAPSEAIIQSQLLFLSLVTFLVITRLNEGDPAFEHLFIKTQLVVLLISFGLAFAKMSLLRYYDPYKIVSISGNNNLYSGYLLISFSFILSGYACFRGFWRYLAIGVAIGSLFFIIIIQSRAGYLGITGALVIAFLLLRFRYRDLLTRRTFRVTFTSLIILLGLVTIFYVSLDTVRRHYFLSKLPVWNYFVSYDEENLEALRRKRLDIDGLTGMPAFDFAESYYENANFRLIFWGKSLPLFLAHPLAGVGAGNWKVVVPSSPLPANPLHTKRNYTYSQPHNELISILTELGLIGLLFALGVFVYPLIIVYRRLLFQADRPPPETIFYVSFITGFYLFSLFDFPLKRVEHNVLLFSAMAFLLSKIPPGTRKAPAIPPVFWKTARFLVPVLLVATVLITAVRMKGEYYTLKVFRNERNDDRQVIRDCRLAGSRWYRITPNNLPVAWFEGVAWYRLGNLKEARSCFEEALTSNPFEVRVLNDYGITLYGLEDQDGAKSVLLRALATDSSFEEAKYNLAAIYFHAGRLDSALFFVNGCTDSGKKEEFLNELEE